MPNNNRVLKHRKQLLYWLLVTGIMLLLVSCQKDVSTTGSDINSSEFQQGKESTNPSFKDRIEEAEGVSLGEPSTLTRSEREELKLNLIGSEIVKCGLSEKEYLEGNVVSFHLKNNTDMELYYGAPTGVEADINGVWTKVYADLSYNDMAYLLEPNKKVELDAYIMEKLPTGRYRLTKEISLVNSTDSNNQEEVVLISDPFIIR
ncbi:immunoglobulin-like domain-containing protein [Paenibacillus sp. An7]|uniref:immunoglobulin-like domain-containing protein n=1 Tax=Paenibacillus sp. An7 TaxID=2689577 RepID=UPI001359979A|nr:immunoglobulin-like domain-containing protein [Paenibacillus sp. An7]